MNLRLPLLACAAAALVVSACGSTNSSSGSTSSSTPAASTPTTATAPSPVGRAAASKLAVQADPSGQLAYVEKALTAKAGKVTINFTNASPVPHDVVIERAGRKLGGTPPIMGSSNSVTLALPKGAYTFYCSVDGHRQAGMQGTLTVN